MPREDLGVAYKVMNVFTFPSACDMVVALQKPPTLESDCYY